MNVLWSILIAVFITSFLNPSHAQFLNPNLPDNALWGVSFRWQQNNATGDLTPQYEDGKTLLTPHIFSNLYLRRFSNGDEEIIHSGVNPNEGDYVETLIHSNNNSSPADELDFSLTFRNAPHFFQDPCFNIRSSHWLNRYTSGININSESLSSNIQALESFGCTENSALGYEVGPLEVKFRGYTLFKIFLPGSHAQSLESKQSYLQRILRCFMGWKHGIYNFVKLTGPASLTLPYYVGDSKIECSTRTPW